MTEQEYLEQIIMDAIDFCTHTRCKKCEYYGKDSAYDYKGKCRGRMMADHLRKNGVVVREWIPVTERLPEDMQERVLVMTCCSHPVGNQQIDTDRCRNGRWVRYGENVTHWMPLPEPPADMRKGDNDG